MKKYLPLLLLAVVFIFSGFNKTNAATNPKITIGYVNPSTAATIYYPATGVVFNGTSITTNAYTAGTATVTSLVFTSNNIGNGQTITNYLLAANIQLWYTTSNTLTGGTEVAGAGIGTSTVTATGTTLTFAGFSQSQAASLTGYFYIVANYNVAASTTGFELDQSNITATGSTITNNGGGYGGGPYNLTVPTITAANDAAGLNPASGGTLYQGTSGYATSGISLKTSSSTEALSNITYNYTIAGGTAFASYFGTPQLYSSTSATFSLTGATPATLVSTATPTVGASTISFAITGTTVTTTTTYYYLVLNYSSAVGAVPKVVTFVPSSYTTALSATAATVAYAVNSYTCAAPTPYVLTLTSLTATANTDGLSATPVPNTATNYSVYGFQLLGSGSTAGTTTITSLTFNQNGGSTDADNLYYTTAYLYSCTTNNYTTGTKTLVATTTSDGSSNIVFTPSTAIAASNTTTTYYFIVLSNTLGDANTSAFRLNYSSSSVTGTAITPAASVAGPLYTFAPFIPFSVTLTSLTTTANTFGLSATPVPNTAANYSVYGFSLTGAGTVANTTTINSLTFNQNGGSTDADNLYYTTAYLYSCTTNNYTTGTKTLVATTTSDGSSNIVFTPSTAITASNTTTTYYFIVLSNTLGDANTSAFRLNYSSSSVTGTAITPAASVAGPLYTFAPYTPFSVTLASLTNAASTDGLSATPVTYGSTNYSVYGFSLTGAGTAANSTTINSLTFTQGGTSTDADNLYYTTAYLYSCTTTNYTTGTKTLVATTTSDGSSNIVFTPTTAINASNTTSAYYFIVLSNTLGDANTNTFKLGYTSSSVTGTALTASAGATGVVGPAYTFKPVPPTTVTFNGIGATGTNPTNGLTASPIATLQSGLAIYGFTLAGSGTGTNQTISSLTFATDNNTLAYNNAFFPTLTLYSSTSSTFLGVGDPSATAIPGAVATLGANYANIVITPTTALTVTSSTTPTYYFLVMDYTTLGTNYTNNNYQLDYSTGVTGSGAAVIATNPDGYDYTFTAPTITTTDVTTGLSPVPPANIYQGQTNLAVAGIGLSISMSSTPLTALVFADSQNKATAALYFSTPQLYVSTSSTFSLTGTTPASLVTGVTTAVANGGNVTFTITGQNITTSTLYYYMVLNYSVTGGAVPEVFQFAPSNYTATVNGGSQSTGYANTPNTYTCAPPIYVSTASTNGFPASTLANSQYGIPIIGFSVSSYPSTTFTTFNFTTTESAGNVGTYFYNVRLYSSATNDFTTATQVTDPGLTVSALTGANFSISGLSQNISNSTVYYFVVVDYTAPNPGPQTFTPTLASVATASTTYSTAANGLKIVGTTYTMKTITTYTYYWWGNGATTDWRDPNNWTTSTNLTGANAGAYPGVFATDNAVASYDYWQSNNATQSATISGYNIAINNFTVTAAYVNFTKATTLNVTVNSTDSLTVASLAVGATGAGKASNLNILGSTSGGVISSMRVTGATNLYNNATLTSSTNGIINFPSGSSFNFVGTTNYDGELAVAGGTVNTNGCNFLFSPNTTAYGGVIAVSSGLLSVNGGTLSMNGVLPEIQSTAGISNFNNTTINITGSNQTGYVTGFALSSYGVVNINGTSANPSVINIGTAANNGVNSEIYLAGGNFNLGAYSTLNINTVNSSTAYYNFYSGGGGVVTCASTSTINPTSSNAWIYNASASNYFTLLSDANGSATVGPLGSGARMTGQYNVQRYISTASRNYRLLASPVNGTNYLPGTATSPDIVNLYALSQSATVPLTPIVTYPGAYVGGPAGSGGGFTATTGGPCLYLYQESIVPSLTYYNSTYYAGKNIAVTSLGAQYLSTQSQANALGGTGATASDNGTNNVVVPPGNGYLLYYIHDNTSTSATTALNATATTGPGFINQGTIPLVMWGATGATTSALTNNGVLPATNPHAFAGLTMVGNPYPSSIDLQKLYTDNNGAVFTNGVNTSFSELDPVNEQFATYGFDGGTVTSSGSDASRYVASGQGFYITVTNPGKTLTFYEDQKNTSAPANVIESIPVTNPLNTVDNVTPGNLKIADALATTTTNAPANITANAPANITDAISPVIKAAKLNAAKADTTKVKKVTLVTAPVAAVAAPAATNTSPAVVSNTSPAPAITGMHLKLVQDSLDYDECGLYFNSKYSDNFDGHDALDQDGVGGKVYLSSYSADKIRTSINSLGDYAGGKRVPLFVKFSTAGIFKLQLEDIANFNSNYSVFLIDNMLKDSLDLTLYKSYNFNYGPGTANDSTRFVLAIEHKPVPYYALLTFAGQKVTQGVQLNWTVKNEFNTTKFVVQKLGANNTYAFLDSLQSDSSSIYDYVDQHPSLGNNTYRLQQTTALGVITYSAPVTIGYNSTSPNGGLNIYPNPAKTQITVTLTTSSTAAQVATADIYNTSGTLIEHTVVNSNSFTHDVSSYQLGVYIIELKNSNGLLVGKSKFVKVQ